MSPTETSFIKKLWIVLLSVGGPFIIAGVLNIIIMVPQVRANTKAIDKFGEGYVSRDEMMRYMESQRELAGALLKGYDDNRILNTEEHQIINLRIDDLMKEVYKQNTRGVQNKSAQIEP